MGYSEKISHALQTKNSLVDSLKNIGVDINSSDSFRQIAQKFKDFLNGSGDKPTQDSDLLIAGVEGLSEAEIVDMVEKVTPGNTRWYNFFKIKSPVDWTKMNETLALVPSNNGSSHLYSPYFFQGYGGDELDLSNFDMTGIPRYLNGFFSSCTRLKSLDLSKARIGVTDEEYTSYSGGKPQEDLNSFFIKCKSLEHVNFGDSSLCTSRTKSIAYMFSECTSLPEIDFGSNFNTSSVTNMGYLFEKCYALRSINFREKFNTEKVTSNSSMFSYCYALEDVIFPENFMPNKSITSIQLNSSPLSKNSIQDLADKISDKSDTSIYTSTNRVYLKNSQKDLFTEDELANLAAQFNAKGWTLSWS